MEEIIDILILNIKPGQLSTFDQLYRDLALPVLKKWNVQVIAFGPSIHEEDNYMVIRSYKSLDDRQKSQDSYYESEDWRSGPREIILSFVKSYSTVVIPANDDLINGFKRWVTS